MAMNIVAFRHTNCDGLGSIAHILKKLGESHVYIDTYLEELDGFDPLAPDLLIVLGGAPGVYQAELYPFLKQERAILERRLAADLPTLGICLGAQLMASALGANVYKGPQGPEKGWFPLTVNEAGMKTPARHFDGAQTNMMQWHGDTFDMPEGAVLLASSAQYKHQIFSYGKNAFGLQCHPEVTPAILKSWLVQSADDAAEGKIDLARMRADNAANAETLMRQTEAFLSEFLSQIRKVRKVA